LRGNKWPYPDTLSNLARALDIDVDALFRREAAKPVRVDDAAMKRFIEDASHTIHKSVALSIP
jgi:hypothetical protein